MTERRNQLSSTRAASSTSGRAISKILSLLAISLLIIGLAVSGCRSYERPAPGAKSAEQILSDVLKLFEDYASGSDSSKPDLSKVLEKRLKFNPADPLAYLRDPDYIKFASKLVGLFGLSLLGTEHGKRGAMLSITRVFVMVMDGPPDTTNPICIYVIDTEERKTVATIRFDLDRPLNQKTTTVELGTK